MPFRFWQVKLPSCKKNKFHVKKQLPLGTAEPVLCALKVLSLAFAQKEKPKEQAG
jgi:hypothetical protein